MKRKFSSALLAAFVAIFTVSETMAGFDFRNTTSKTVWVVFQWYTANCGGSGKSWRTQGWWRLAPGETKTVFANDLQSVNRYFYFYAENSGNGVWDGAFKTCVPISKFEWCLDTCNTASQTRTLGFREVYIENNNHFTVELVE